MVLNSNESIPPDPFVVRAHHANHIYRIVGMGMSVDELLASTAVSEGVTWTYLRDVFGDTPMQKENTRAKHRQFFEDFMNLPDESTVRFVAGQKDAICEACAIGEHCETTKLSADTKFLKAISRLAREKGFGELIIESEVELEDSKEPSPFVEVPAGVAKIILNDLDFHAQTYPKLARPLARLTIKRDMKTYGLTHIPLPLHKPKD